MKSGTEKKPNPCEAPLGVYLRALAAPMGPETAKHYRLRRDGAIVRATPKPQTRKPKRAKRFNAPKSARRQISEAMQAASGREALHRKRIAAAIKKTGAGELVKRDLLPICRETGLPLSVVRDFAPRKRGRRAA